MLVISASMIEVENKTYSQSRYWHQPVAHMLKGFDERVVCVLGEKGVLSVPWFVFFFNVIFFSNCKTRSFSEPLE